LEDILQGPGVTMLYSQENLNLNSNSFIKLNDYMTYVVFTK